MELSVSILPDAGEEKLPRSCNLAEKDKDFTFKADPWNNLKPCSKEKAKRILYQWLEKISNSEAYYVLSESLPLAIIAFDRFLAQRPITLAREIQLFMSACIILASKYVGAHDDRGIIFFPKDLEYLCGNSYSVKELIEAEAEVLKAIDYNLELYTPDHYRHKHDRILFLGGWISLLINDPLAFSYSLEQQYQLVDRKLTLSALSSLAALKASIPCSTSESKAAV